MGFGGISIWQLLIILVIVVLIFGTKKLKSMGSDLGGAVKGFKDSMTDDKQADDELKSEEKPEDAGESDTTRVTSEKENPEPVTGHKKSEKENQSR